MHLVVGVAVLIAQVADCCVVSVLVAAAVGRDLGWSIPPSYIATVGALDGALRYFVIVVVGAVVDGGPAPPRVAHRVLRALTPIRKCCIAGSFVVHQIVGASRCPSAGVAVSDSGRAAPGAWGTATAALLIAGLVLSPKVVSFAVCHFVRAVITAAVGVRHPFVGHSVSARLAVGTGSAVAIALVTPPMTLDIDSD